jgi:hypothetical protein
MADHGTQGPPLRKKRSNFKFRLFGGSKEGNEENVNNVQSLYMSGLSQDSQASTSQYSSHSNVFPQDFAERFTTGTNLHDYASQSCQNDSSYQLDNTFTTQSSSNKDDTDDIDHYNLLNTTGLSKSTYVDSSHTKK